MLTARILILRMKWRMITQLSIKKSARRMRRRLRILQPYGLIQANNQLMRRKNNRVKRTKRVKRDKVRTKMRC